MRKMGKELKTSAQGIDHSDILSVRRANAHVDMKNMSGSTHFVFVCFVYWKMYLADQTTTHITSQ